MSDVESRLLRDKATFASAIGIGDQLSLDEAIIQGEMNL